MKRTIKAIFEAAAAKPERKYFALEMMGVGELPPEAAAMELDQPEELSSDDQLREAFKSLIMGVLDDTTLSLDQMGDKIVALLTVQDDAEAALSGSGGGGGSAGGDGDGDGEKGPPAAESKAGNPPPAGGAAAAAAAAGAQVELDPKAILESTDLLHAAKQPAPRAILEAMARLPDTAARQAFVAALPAPVSGGLPTVPRSAPPPAQGSGGSAHESKVPGEGKYEKPGEFAAALRGGHL